MTPAARRPSTWCRPGQDHGRCIDPACSCTCGHTTRRAVAARRATAIADRNRRAAARRAPAPSRRARVVLDERGRRLCPECRFELLVKKPGRGRYPARCAACRDARTPTRSRGARAAGLAVGVVALLTACVPVVDPVPPPSTSPSTTVAGDVVCLALGCPTLPPG